MLELLDWSKSLPAARKGIPNSVIDWFYVRAITEAQLTNVTYLCRRFLAVRDGAPSCCEVRWRIVQISGSRPSPSTFWLHVICTVHLGSMIDDAILACPFAICWQKLLQHFELATASRQYAWTKCPYGVRLKPHICVIFIRSIEKCCSQLIYCYQIWWILANVLLRCLLTKIVRILSPPGTTIGVGLLQQRKLSIRQWVELRKKLESGSHGNI